MKRNITSLTIIFLIFLIFKNYQLLLDSTTSAISIWLTKVFPYLFIMLTLNDILINTNILSYFKYPSLYIFFTSILSGTPSSAYITSKLYKTNKITRENANQTLIYTYFNNPLFLLNILTSIFSNIYIVIKLIIIHYLSNIILLFIYKECEQIPLVRTFHSINLSNSIKSSINTTTMVLGSICFYLVISNILLNSIKLPLIVNITIRGLLEITQGLNSLITANIPFKEIICSLFLSFGGLSIHTQVKCILEENNLDYKYFLKGRILGTIIAVILTSIT